MQAMFKLMLGGALATFFVAEATASDCVLRVTTWGGNYQRTYESVASEFENKYDCRIEWVVGSTADFTVRARAGQVDVVTNNLLYAVAGEKEGLWMDLDESKIPNMSDLYEKAKYSPQTVWVNVGDYALAYNSKYVKEEPQSWDVLWNKDYRNRVVLYSFNSPDVLSLAVIEAEKHGGSFDNIEPGLQRIADLVNSGNVIAMIDIESQLVSLFEAEEAWLGPLTTGRIKDLWDRGMDHIKLARPKEGTFPVITAMNVVKTTDNPEMAMNFVNFALGKTAQEAFAIRNLYAPTNRTVELPADFKYRDVLVQGDAFDRLYLLDPAKLNEVRGKWQEKFQRMLK